MKLILIAFLVSFTSMAESYYNYDYSTGNSYKTRENADGSSTTYGNNYGTGSSWRSRTDSFGNSTGTDSSGNMWRYNGSSGSYYNTDGTVCTGKGQSRICTK